MKEIEIKIQVQNVSELKTKLENLGCKFSEIKKQEDFIYIPKTEKTLPVPAGVNVLRVRKENEKILMTLKRSDFGNNLSKLEKELGISNAEVMQDIFELLEYKKIVEVKKSRVTCRYLDYEICIDEVENLGSFMEVEKICNEDAFKVQNEMYQMLEQINIGEYKKVEYGYDVLLVQKQST